MRNSDAGSSRLGLYLSKRTFPRILKHCSLMLVILFFLGGCGPQIHHYIPRSSTFKFDSIDEFSSNHSISFVNSQTSSDDMTFATRGKHKFLCNLQKWTDTAIEITQRELKSRGMNVAPNAPKSLKLSIETAQGTLQGRLQGTVVFWDVRCEVYLKVETGEGYVNSYLGDNRSPWDLYRATDGAVMRAVAEMLRDKEIVAYLKK